MVENMSPNNLKTSAMQKELNGNWRHPITHSRMGLQKGIVRSIMGASRAVLHDQILPLHLWAEACNTVVYLQNRSLHRILGMKTPMEAYSRKQPDVSHFWIFRSSVYYHVTKDAKEKLDPTTELGILMGYTDTPHNYWVYLPSTQRTVVRRDLKFDK